jgi:hypothetical protein
MFKHLAAFALILGVLATSAAAAELTSVGEGGLLNGAATDQVPAALSAGDRVQGPATVTSAAGDTFKLAKNSVLEIKDPAPCWTGAAALSVQRTHLLPDEP